MIDTYSTSRESIQVLIIQPLVPEYRLSLFRRLARHEGLCVNVLASSRIPGLNLLSVAHDEVQIDLMHPCLGLFGNRFFWQRNMRIDPSMGEGDVLVISGNLRFLSNIPLIWKAKKKKIGVVWWAHGSSNTPNWFRSLIIRFIVRLVEVRLLYTDKEKETYARLGCPAAKLHALNNAIDLAPIEKAILSWQGQRLLHFQQREHIANKKLLLFCGRRTRTVSLGLVFAALAQLKNTSPNHLFVIIGPDRCCDAAGEKARELGVDDCVRWIGPMFDQNALAPWFLSADCFVFPGPIGLSIIHAFAYGLPVIVPDCEHKPEIAAFSDGENGLFYRNGNTGDLASKITAITGNQMLQRKLSANAKQIVAKRFNLDHMLDRFVGAIKGASRLNP